MITCLLVFKKKRSKKYIFIHLLFCLPPLLYSLLQVFEEHLYGVLVGPWQLLHQILNCLNFVLVIWHFYTKNAHKSVKCARNISLRSCVSNIGVHSLIAAMKSLKKAKVNRGSGSSRKNIFRAPVVT